MRSAIPVALALATLAASARAQSDLESYVAGIRASGMSELAAGQLRTIAAPLAGASTLRVRRQGRTLSWAYEPTKCFLPGADAKARALRHQIRDRMDAWVKYLKRYADADGSGFVTTDEANALRNAVEQALLLVDVGSRAEADALGLWRNEDPRQIAEGLATYERIRVDAIRDGLEGMPALP